MITESEFLMSVPQQQSEHSHDFRYYACVNLWNNGEVVGVVDVWRCSICHVKGTELRAQGLNNLATEAGFRELDGPETNWVVFVCGAEENLKFELLNVHIGDLIKHECVENSQIRVGPNYKLEDKNDKYHKIESIENYLNETMDLALAGHH
jgi:hypothetical protein